MNNIVFRKDKTGEVTAVFLNDIAHHNALNLVCYAHMGQHGVCSIDWLYTDTKPAKATEYQKLLLELTNHVGYTDLKIVSRLPSYPAIIKNITRLQSELTERVKGAK